MSLATHVGHRKEAIVLPTLEEQPWRQEALCGRDENPDAWYGEANGEPDPEEAGRALLTCWQCPVIDLCLSEAIENNETEGIRGGQTPEERLGTAGARGQVVECIALVAAGFTDLEVSKQVGVTDKAVANARRRRGIEGNVYPGARSSLEYLDRMHLYKFGLPDQEIASRLNSNPDKIKHWRKANNLPRTQKQEEEIEAMQFAKGRAMSSRRKPTVSTAPYNPKRKDKA